MTENLNLTFILFKLLFKYYKMLLKIESNIKMKFILKQVFINRIELKISKTIIFNINLSFFTIKCIYSQPDS
jgi:hypothetical protein